MSTTPADAETGEIHQADAITPPPGFRLAHEPMGLDEAKQITTKINSYAVSLCHLIAAAYDGRAWVPLGCDSWESYCDEHLNVSRQRAHQLIHHAKKLSLLAGIAGVPADALDVPERHTRTIDLAEALEVVGEAIEALPEDAPIATRGDLVKAITAHMQATALAAKPITASTAVDADKPSSDPDPAPDADERTRDGSTPIPGASTDPQNAGHAAGDAAATGEAGNASTPTDPDPSPSPEGSGSTETPLDLVARAGRARTKAHDFLHLDVVALVDALDAEGRESWALTSAAIRKQVDALDAALAPQPLRSVQ